MTIELAQTLIRCPSITPGDAGCQRLLADRLDAAGFAIEHLRYGEVDNLWATHGSGTPVFTFLGHTDVVPTGPLGEWRSDPFHPEIRDGCLYGRGAADMKGSIAAMVTALERFAAAAPDHRGTLALLLTSDEEGPAVNGTRKVMETLTGRGIAIDWCLVGEPTSRERTGDCIKNGRRGSLHGSLIIHGVQGHIAHPSKARNPIHQAAPALHDLCSRVWDRGNDHYPPTSFQISNINGGTGADNVIPGALDILFNFRFSTETDVEQLTRTVIAILDRHELQYDIDWRVSGYPFLTRSGPLLDAVRETIREVAGLDAEVSTDGGTSDGRFVAPTGAEVIELGPVNSTIHKIDECVRVDDLLLLSRLYQRILERLLGEAAD